MTRPRYVDLARGILDHQIVDSEDRRCGNVDDLEIDVDSGEVTAILVGPKYWPQRVRGPVGRLLARLGGNRGRRVEWKEVESVTSAVVLGCKATDVGLGEGDERARKWVAWMPGS
jgi:sporulation protein YlmC with PRC-barrel domain